MTKTLDNPRALFVDAEGKQSLGALEFYDGDTGALKVVYYDRLKQSTAPNPIPIDANGIVPVVWGDGFYKVKQYKQIDNTLGTFPDDYSFVREWYWDATSTSSSESFASVSTMSELKTLAPVNGDIVTLLGYYEVGDTRVRSFRFDSASVDTPNDGNRVRPNGYGSGVWIENSSDVIDARDFGCMHPTLTTNGNILQAVSYCNAENIELKFPSGVYNVTGATVSILAPLTIEAGAFFNVQGISIFTLAPTGNWSLPYETQIGTTQYFILDLTGSDYVSPNGASLQWWNGTSLSRISKAIEKCGASGIGIHGTVIVPDDGGAYTGYILSRLVFHEGAVLQINASAGTFEVDIDSIEFLGSNQTGVFTGNYHTSLTINGNINSKWFKSGSFTSQNIASVIGTNSVLYLDNTIYIDSNVNLGKVSSNGGYLSINGGATVDLNIVGRGEKFIQINDSASIVNGCNDVRSFYLNTQNQILGFIRSASYIGSQTVDFQGIYTTVALTISSGSYKISNWNHSSTLTADTLELQNCYFTNTVTVNSLISIGCRYTDLLVKKNGANYVDLVLKNCLVFGRISFQTLSTDQINRLVIEECVNMGTTSPLDVSGLLCSSLVSNGFVSVKNNTPPCYDDSSVNPKTWAQSYIDVNIGVTGSSQSTTYSIASKAWAMILPNIATYALNLLTVAKTLSSTAVYHNASVSGSNISVESTVAFTGTPRTIRVTGNLY